LSAVLGDLVEADEMAAGDVDHVASLITRDNARRIYGI
jgi:hypothetical protein